MHRESVESQAREIVLHIVAALERVEDSEREMDVESNDKLSTTNNSLEEQLINVETIETSDSSNMGQHVFKPESKEPMNSSETASIVKEVAPDAINVEGTTDANYVKQKLEVHNEIDASALSASPILAIIDSPELDVSVNIVGVPAPVEEYRCKVQPTEYDISIDEAIQACDNDSIEKPDLSIIREIVPADDLVDETTIPKAILISTKSAMVALDLASAPESTANFDAQINEATVTAVEEETLSTNEENLEVARSLVETILHQISSNSIGIDQSISDTFVTVSETPTEAGTEPNALELSPLKIPLVIVSESAEPAVPSIPSPKPLTKQSSLEIPNIECRENFIDLMRTHGAAIATATALQSNNDLSEEIESDFVIVTREDLHALQIAAEEDAHKLASHTLTNPTNSTANCTTIECTSDETQIQLTTACTISEVPKCAGQYIGTDNKYFLNQTPELSEQNIP